MLTKGFKDEDQERIGEALGDLTSIEFLPDDWEAYQRKELNLQLEQLIHISLNDIVSDSSATLLEHIHSLHLSFGNYEKLGDLLWRILPLEPESEEQNLAEKIVAIYEYAQNESKMFSFGLIEKINEAKSLL